MKKISKIFLIGIICLLVFSTVIAFVIIDKKRTPNKIVLITKSISLDFEFWQTVKMGAELAAKEENIVIETRGAELEKDIEEQKRIFKETIDEKPDIILLAASDEYALVELIQEAKNNNITILTVDSKAEGVSDIKHVATNNVEAAKTLTKYMVDSIEQSGEVIMINFFEGASTAKEREAGYKEEIKRYSSITVHPTVYAGGTVQGAYRVAKEVIKKYPHLKAIVGGNQPVTDGICDAVKEMGLEGKIMVVGFDSSNTIIYAIEKGILDSIIVQKPFNMGYLAVKYSIDMYKGKTIPDFIDTGYKFINKETLYYTENQKLLYPIIK